MGVQAQFSLIFRRVSVLFSCSAYVVHFIIILRTASMDVWNSKHMHVTLGDILVPLGTSFTHQPWLGHR